MKRRDARRLTSAQENETQRRGPTSGTMRRARVVAPERPDGWNALANDHSHADVTSAIINEQLSSRMLAHGLTAAHVRLLRAAMESSSRQALSLALGISPGTVKAHTHEILIRSGAGTLEELVIPLRRAALGR